MTARPGRLLTDPRPPARLDVLLAAALAVYGLGHVWLHWIPDEGRHGGPQGLNTAVILLGTLPLAWRRRAPLAVLLVVVATFSVSLGLTDAAGSFYAGLLPVVLSWYAVARHGTRREAAIGIAATLVGWAILAAGTHQFRGAEELVFDAILFASAWIGGVTIRAGERRAGELGRHAERLERDREAQARAAVLDERARIARELHDVVAHGMSLMVVQAGAARSLLDGAPVDTRVHGHLQALETSGRQSLSEMRRLLTVLRDDDELALEPLPGMAQLPALVEAARAAEIDVTVQVDGAAGPLPPGIDLTAYRIVQEALTNTIKHAGPACARVAVRYHPDAVELEIVDDGRGAAAAATATNAAAGHGLIGMRERAALYGGDLHAAACDGGGYAVRVRLPIAEPA